MSIALSGGWLDADVEGIDARRRTVEERGC
jgi:hypothetical protein